MSRYRLRSPEQPWPVRVLLGAYEFCASLKLAVILIFLAAAILGWGTFVESRYGTPAVQFAVYGTWWFTLINTALAVNIFCAAAIRYPWKRHQTGFVITHIGLLVLLFGCLLSRNGGIDAQMPLFEGRSGAIAYEDTSHFELRIAPAAGSAESKVDVVPFTCGPVNWPDLAQMPWYWRLAKRDQGVVYDRDGVRLEVLDFYSRAEQTDAPYVQLAMTSPGQPRMDEETGRPLPAEMKWQKGAVTLRIQRSTNPQWPFGIGDGQMAGGGQITFAMTNDAGETEAFTQLRPTAPIGRQGQAVVWAGGRAHVVAVDERAGKGRFDLPDTGLQLEVLNVYRQAQPAADSKPGQITLAEGAAAEAPGAENPAIELAVYRGEEPAGRLVLFADLPYLNAQDYAHGVFGAYWFDHGEMDVQQRMSGQRGSRIDILQGADHKLYYRYWNRKEVVAAGPLPGDGTPVDAFKMPIAQLQMKVEEHVALDAPGKYVRALPFDKKEHPSTSTRAARVRLTVDEAAREFWIVSKPVGLLAGRRGSDEEETVASAKRSVTLAMPLDTIDVGFQVKLLDFERKLDPGTSQPSHYSSVVQFCDRQDETKLLRSGDTLITMNAPVDFTDPKTRRSYRLFQESFNGPYLPGDPIFNLLYDPAQPRQQLFASVLTVNYDPGRGTKYAGGLLIVVGIVTMFYMKAYFLTGGPRPAPATSRKRPAEAVEPEAKPVAAGTI
ncbi:MAG: cytochrome c biogenesis protein ResB [Pirellulales bacterium]|nr:cytochrome c biogenesis protein ResB [Pirellulales bacterium]